MLCSSVHYTYSSQQYQCIVGVVVRVVTVVTVVVEVAVEMAM